MTPPEAHAAQQMHLVKSPDDKSIKDHPAAQDENAMTILSLENQKILTENHNGEKVFITILIMGNGLIAYHF